MTVAKYVLFAVIATLINIIFQILMFTLYSGFGSLFAAMAVGTLAGLVSKYILDKHFIFCVENKAGAKDFQTFILYSFTGVFTTFLFWGTEMLFHYIFESPIAKYIGAIIGLAMGYTCKYFLDKKYVFVGDRA